MSTGENPKKAYGDAKLPVHLVPPALVLGAAKALGEGAAKYGPYNWRSTRVEAMTYVGAMLRHIAAYLDGEDIDPESSTGKTHLDGIAGSLAVLMDATYSGYLDDNRPPKGAAPRLVRTPADSERALVPGDQGVRPSLRAGDRICILVDEAEGAPVAAGEIHRVKRVNDDVLVTTSDCYFSIGREGEAWGRVVE